MTSRTPRKPKIYHIIHVERLNSLIQDGFLYSDFAMQEHSSSGPSIGMQKIKERRLSKSLQTYNDLTVGQCVPFYFCPRSVMLYVINCKNNPDLDYCEGQRDIIHLEFDMDDVIEWSKDNGVRYVFTTSNAGSYYFEDYNDFTQLDKINWEDVKATYWSDKTVKENKQAEFLVEKKVDMKLIKRIGVHNLPIYQKVTTIISKSDISKTNVELREDWYY